MLPPSTEYWLPSVAHLSLTLAAREMVRSDAAVVALISEPTRLVQEPPVKGLGLGLRLV